MVAVETMADSSGDREAAFRAEVAGMKVRGGTVARERLLSRVGVGLLVAGIALGVAGYLTSTGADAVNAAGGASAVGAAEQRDSIVLALVGVAVSVAGLALFLRYSLGALLRLWLARLVLDRDERG